MPLNVETFPVTITNLLFPQRTFNASVILYVPKNAPFRIVFNILNQKRKVKIQPISKSVLYQVSSGRKGNTGKVQAWFADTRALELEMVNFFGGKVFILPIRTDTKKKRKRRPLQTFSRLGALLLAKRDKTLEFTSIPGPYSLLSSSSVEYIGILFSDEAFSRDYE